MEIKTYCSKKIVAPFCQFEKTVTDVQSFKSIKYEALILFHCNKPKYDLNSVFQFENTINYETTEKSYIK